MCALFFYLIVMKLLFAYASLIILIALVSCKYDSLTPINSGARNMTLINLTLDSRPLSYNYTNTSTTPQIVLTFSDPIDRTSAQSNISLSGTTGNIAIGISFTHHDSVVIISPSSPLKYFSIYYLQLPAGLSSTTKKKLSTTIAVKIITEVNAAPKFPIISDSALLDLVQQQTLKYFYDFGHPGSGMARERNTSGDIVTTGGSGFGIMAMIAGINRGFISRSDGITRFNKIISFLETADRFHGAWPHWMNGNTGKVVLFGTNDNGADIVETSYMIQGLLTLRQYLTSTDTAGNNSINRINTLYQNIEWDWFRQNNQNVLYWNWSPDHGWAVNVPVRGYNETLITYLLAAGSPTHSIPVEVYQQGWAQGGAIKNGKSFYGRVLPLGQDYGGPLFFTQYSFLGFDPHVHDSYLNVDYWTQNVNQSLINHDYCVANPKKFVGYGDNCWGLTASDNPSGYSAQSPTNDNGTITPTAAISSMPYTPAESMKAINYFYYTLGDRMWGQYGFYDAVNITSGWTAT